MNKLRWIHTYISFWRILPVYIFLNLNRFHKKCKQDLEVWIAYAPETKGHCEFWQFGYILVNYRETRNIFLNRLHRNPLMYFVTVLFFHPLESLYINMPPEKIGGGFSLQHGFSTIIAAKEIGERCRVFQQVTIGYNGEYCPIIGDDVSITAGAIVIGDICIGNNVIVGAGSVVIDDVPENTTVAGVPARTIHSTSQR